MITRRQLITGALAAGATAVGAVAVAMIPKAKSGIGNYTQISKQIWIDAPVNEPALRMRHVRQYQLDAPWFDAVPQKPFKPLTYTSGAQWRHEQREQDFKFASGSQWPKDVMAKLEARLNGRGV
jgi:hypothetical protein